MDTWATTIQVFASVITILLAVSVPITAAFWFRSKYESLKGPTEDIRESIADPSRSHGTRAYITRATLLEEIRKKGCVETCPAIPILRGVVREGMDSVQDEMKEFVRDSAKSREENIVTLKAIFERLSSVLGTMETVNSKLLDIILRKSNGN